MYTVISTSVHCVHSLYSLPGSPPGLEGHDPMMEDMKEGEVGELLGEEEKDAVHHVEEFGYVEPPGHI